MAIFDNFRVLKENMQRERWVIEAFTFEYKAINYVVLVKLYQENKNRPKYALLETEFLKENKFENSLIIPVNVTGFMIDTKTLREFFAIEYSKNLGDILQQFTKYFSNFIPTKINLKKSDSLLQSIHISLSISDSEDPNKKYCFNIKRNPLGELRTLYNDNKTRILRPNLYDKFANERTISFCYTKDADKEKSDNEIILNFSKRL